MSPSPSEVNSFHDNDDVDESPFAHHHTLGKGANQAAAGNHTHDLADIKGSESIFKMPPGVVVPFAGSDAPDGWAVCDGAALSRTDDAALYAVIGTTYGVGDGSTTFNLPNLKGRIPVGHDSTQTEFNALGKTGGAKTHTLSISEIPSHTHDYNTNSVGESSAWGGVAGASRAAYFNYTSYPATSAAGGGGAHNNLQPYLVVNYIIALG